MKIFDLIIENRFIDRWVHAKGVQPCLILTITNREGYKIGESALPLSELKKALDNLEEE